LSLPHSFVARPRSLNPSRWPAARKTSGSLPNVWKRPEKSLRLTFDAKRLPGAVLLMARNGKIAFYDVVGYQDRATQTPMKKDSIFRIASMSKPITTVAAMILAEENKLDVGAPVAQYLPGFKDVKVGRERARRNAR
jgi:CubicO group peptidase (beta-lactamase class C family)